MEIDDTPIKAKAKHCKKLMDDFCEEFTENSALYLMAAFMVVIQFFFDHAA